MSPSIDLTDELFARLQKHAVPLVDTPLTVITRALDALEAGDEDPVSPVTSAGPRSFNPAAPPNLSHTTPRRAEVAGQALPRGETYWNSILFAVLNEAAKKGTSAQDLIELLTIPCVQGEKEGSGYRYLPQAGISVQGQDANRAWKQTYRIASSIGVPVQVLFVWQDNPKAAMPNSTGSFFVEG
jgi:hypothetical protein